MATTLFDFDAKANEPPASNAAAPTIVNGTLVLAFDAGTEESAIFTGVMPQVYAAGTLTAYVWYTMDSATADDVIWAVQIEALADNENAESDSFDSANTATVTVPGTAGLLDAAAVTLTNKDSVAAGELVRVKVYRDADAAGDTATGDAFLYRVEIRES